MTTTDIIDALRLARQTIAELSPDDDVLTTLDKALLSEPAFTIGLSHKPNHDFAVQLPSGITVTMPASLEAIKELLRLLRQYAREAGEARRAPNIGEAQALFFARTRVGDSLSPVQYDIDKAMLKKYDAKGNQVLPMLSLDDLDEEIA